MNSHHKGPLVLSIDDDPITLKLIGKLLSRSGYNVITVNSGLKGLQVISKNRPDLILLDVEMPGMDGYEVCDRLQKCKETAYIPVIFVTSFTRKEDKAKAFSVGAVDYLVKPIQKNILLQKVSTHIKTNAQWEKLRDRPQKYEKKAPPTSFNQFKEFLFDRLNLNSDKRNELSNISESDIYSTSLELGTDNSTIAQYMAEFLKLSYVADINSNDVQLGILPTPFCKSNHVVAVNDFSVGTAFIVSNPFDWDLLDNLKRFTGLEKTLKFMISKPENIDLLFRHEASTPVKVASIGKETQSDTAPAIETITKLTEAEIKKHPIIYITNTIIEKAVSERASDIHIEPKETNTVVRFRIDGDLMEFFSLKKNTANKIISRFKIVSGLDISEKRKPQDGAFSLIINNRKFNFRVATTSTPNGESVVMRLLEPEAKPKELTELGMTDEQADTLIRLVNRHSGIIIMVGTTGSGKSTTIFSLLHKTDCKTRSLMTVEDPVEYHIPLANQQQVNEKAGVTFEAILKSAVRQDPDILFMGEVRDTFSAKISIDFASTGHLTVTTLHTSNATSAIFRLERLGVDRGVMADTVLCIVAQKLLKKLCPHCKKIDPISQEEIEMLSQFTDDIPSEVAHPVGCSKCHNTGYYGREGVQEILEFDPEIAEMVRSGAAVAEIRSFARERGDFQIGNHAADKVKKLIVSPKDAYEKVLVEDLQFEGSRTEDIIPKTEPEIIIPKTEPQAAIIADRNSILVADDDDVTRQIIATILEKQGYKVTVSQDGIDALLSLAKTHFDLILSDVDMPNLNGFKLLEMMNQKGLNAPVIFLTGRDTTEDKKRGLELGALDYIKKPISKDILLLRVKSVLQKLHKFGG
ncbi:MAG: ATPase, T2SS/T4P/T4SS family [Thermodesulfobacteriota bacterium]|nr:ATPase, T2SS/T4P/T4SS family [Thermodesulfobacteriota bacterium]